MMEEVLTAFAHLIRDRRVLTDRRDNQLSECKARLTFTDGSLLEFSEIWLPRLTATPTATLTSSGRSTGRCRVARGGDENSRPGYDDPRQAVETCGMVEQMASDQLLMRFTGAPMWADNCEDVAFNTLPAAFMPDYRSLRYLTAPNMVVSDSKNHSPGLQNEGPFLMMNPFRSRCCQHNHSNGRAYYAENLWMATLDNGLAAVLYTVLTSTWKTGDKITLDLPMDIAVRTRNRNKNSVSVNYGPLAYSLKIDEKFQQENSIKTAIYDSKWKPAADPSKWPSYEIFPTSAWHYGLVLASEPAQSFTVTRKPGPMSKYPFTPGTAPITLTAKARKIPSWTIDKYGLCDVLPQSPVTVNTPTETVTLVPMGAARLRISVSPVVQ